MMLINRNAVRAGARPFTASKQAVRPCIVRVAAPDAPEAEMEPLVLADEEEVAVERVVLDDDARVAQRAAEALVSNLTLETVLEAELSSEANVQNRASALLENSLENSKGNFSAELEAAAAAAISGVSAVESEGIEDYVGPEGFRKYDEEEAAAAISDTTRATIQKFKLTRQELNNLLPSDWDTVNVDWFTSKKEENIPLPDYKLNFLWQRENLFVAVDQVYSRGQTSPLTEYFVWPRKDAWDELRVGLESRPVVSERDKVILLNRLTEVINFWQGPVNEDGTVPAGPVERPSLAEAKAAFPDCSFA